METFLSKYTSTTKFSWRFDQFQRYKPNCGKKCPISQCWKVRQKIPRSGFRGRWLL